jgi:2-C-methyl-D-erythritol 4-phosphate cytidylyltransferase/2-C-methyl-D-erythritol 2,4-cyclodiphosphate synthase
MHVAAIVAAGGRGLRLGADRPKQFLDLGGRPMLELSVQALARSSRIHEIVVALPKEHLGEAHAWTTRFAKPVSVVAGGPRRQDSVANAFRRTSPAADLILVHDAARPFVTEDVIARTVDAAAAYGAAIAGVAVGDTVKQTGAPDADGSRVIQSTLRRDEIVLAQTPQAFRRELFARALETAGGADVTDEAMLAEQAGIAVRVVPGDPANIKVTTAADLERARARLEGRRLMRIGTGYDLHRLVQGRKLILGGVPIPFDRGLEGHSDADIVCHAVTDAVLGAAAAGDIGRLFPDHDPRWKDADSLVLLRGAMDRVRAAGFSVANVDVTVVAERPKLLPYLDAMRANLASALGASVDAVSIKGKTNEGVDGLGRGDAMACHAVVLLHTA